MSNSVKPPRVEWAVIGDGLGIAANKTILVWTKKTGEVVAAVVLPSATDERGDLYTEDAGTRLNWADYGHYCYKTPPKSSSADKGVFVYAADPKGSVLAWQLVWRGQSHERESAEAVETAAKNLGLLTRTNYTGHAPKD